MTILHGPAGFEAGSAAEFDGTTVNGLGTVTFPGAAAAYAGSHGLRCVVANGASNDDASVHETWTAPASNIVYVKGRVKVIAAPSNGNGQYLTTFRTSTPNASIAYVRVVNGAWALWFRQKDGTYGTVALSAAPTLGTYQLWELEQRHDLAQPTCTLWIDGTQVATITDATAGTTYVPNRYIVGLFGTAVTGTLEADYDDFQAEDVARVTSSFVLAGPNSAATLPTNHNGNITVTLTGTGTSWSAGTPGTPTFSLDSAPTGWAKVSQSVASATSATVVLSCPAVASPPVGATGTIVIGDGATTASITVATPTLVASPTSGVTATPTYSRATAFTGTNTLWQGDDPDFTLSGGTGASIAATTVTNNSSASASVSYGTAVGTLTITDPSTGAQTTIAADAAAAPAVARGFILSG